LLPHSAISAASARPSSVRRRLMRRSGQQLGCPGSCTFFIGWDPHRALPLSSCHDRVRQVAGGENAKGNAECVAACEHALDTLPWHRLRPLDEHMNAVAIAGGAQQLREAPSHPRRRRRSACHARPAHYHPRMAIAPVRPQSMPMAITGLEPPVRRRSLSSRNGPSPGSAPRVRPR